MESLRWEKEVRCPYCDSSNNVPIKGFRHHCNNCKRSFSVTVGTIFENSRLPLVKWFGVIFMVLNAKKGISARELQRNIGLTYKTAWYTAMKIRCAMIQKSIHLSSVLEMDESYIKASDDPSKTVISTLKAKRGRGTSKTAIVGIVERGGKVIPKVVDRLTTKNLMSMLKDSVKDESAILITDEFSSYKRFDEVIEHLTVQHKKTFSKGFTNINTIEGFWSIIKNGIKGNYQAISKRYLPFYLVEYQYKYNLRNSISDEFEIYIKNALTAEHCMINYKPMASTEEIIYGK
jgi:transposase-like protein